MRPESKPTARWIQKEGNRAPSLLGCAERRLDLEDFTLEMVRRQKGQRLPSEPSAPNDMSAIPENKQPPLFCTLR